MYATAGEHDSLDLKIETCAGRGRLSACHRPKVLVDWK
jgi:hypothetical protein